MLTLECGRGSILQTHFLLLFLKIKLQFLMFGWIKKKETHEDDNERVSNYKIRGRKDTIDLVKIY